MASAVVAAAVAERPAIRELLVAAGLPVADLDEATIDFLVVRGEDEAIVGVVGLEAHADAGLLRSLAVMPQRRDGGLGRALVAAVERVARQRGLRELVLLTQTAAGLFAKLGYETIARDAAPAAVQGSREFAALCPASATCMRKRLAPRRVLFVCIENSNRSQMAEGFARRHGGAGVEAHSAGSRPSGAINPKALRFMAERGIDLGTHASKSLQDVAGLEFDAVVTMGCGDSCPWIPARRREDWALADPRGMDDDGYRAVRDDIEARVQALLATL